MLKRLLGGVAIIAMAATSTSCAMTLPPSSATANCAWTTPAAGVQQAVGTSATVVLIDDSASFWPKTGMQVSLPDDPVSIAVTAMLRDFSAPGTHLVSLGTFDGSSTTVNWKLSDTALPTPTGDGDRVSAQEGSASNCLTSVVKSALRTSPQAPGTDVMAAIAAAGQQLQGVPASADQVVLVTDGLSNTGCLNLSNIISQGESAASVLASCPERSALAALHGVTMHLYGIGLPADAMSLTTAEQSWVENYYGEICTALSVASPASCVAPAAASTVRASAVSRSQDPAITFPTVPRRASIVPVPADLLFAFNSAQLSAAGQAYLDILAGQLKAQGRTIAKVVGHTDATGTASYNLDLSQRRANAVVAYLARYGFTNVTASGVGEAEPVCSPQYSPSGAPLQSCMAKNRRVQIFLGG